jgi:hypothetical protein
MHGEVCKSVYCHWDGYLEHNGAILLEHYDSSKANQLVAMGDLSSLGRVLGEKRPFSKFEIKDEDPEREAKLALIEQAESEGWCTFYDRDRGETDCTWSVDHTFEDFLARADGCGAEFYYVMKDGTWYVGDTYGSTGLSNKLTPLAEALQAVETV